HDDAARRRRLCFPARSLRTSIRIFIRLDPLSCRANRNDRGGGGRIRTIPRGFFAGDCWRLLSDRANRGVAVLRAQSFERTIGRNSPDRVSHFLEYARTSCRQDRAEQFHLYQNGGAIGRYRHWAAFRLEIELRGAGLALVECARKRVEPAGRTTRIRRDR